MVDGELRGRVEATIREALDTLEAFVDDVSDRAQEGVKEAVTKVRDACNDYLASGEEATPEAPNEGGVATDTTPPPSGDDGTQVVG